MECYRCPGAWCVQCPASAASFAACAVCFSLRAAFRVCHDLLSVFGFGFNLLCARRLDAVVVLAMVIPLFNDVRDCRGGVGDEKP
jgi:hypothetical protein